MQKVKITAADKAKEKIMQLLMDSWIEENPTLLDDINELSTHVVSFNAKYGTNLEAKDIIS